MTTPPLARRYRPRRWMLALFAAALVLYGVAGFPGGGEPGPPSAAAHPLPGFPHYHGGIPVCGALGCPPPDDGTNERPPDDRPGNSRPGNNHGGSDRPANCVGAHADGCEQGVEQGYINPGDDLDAQMQTPEAISQMGQQFADHPNNQEVDFDPDEFADAMSNAKRPPQRGDIANALCAAISSCSGTGDEAIQHLLDNDISLGQDDDSVDGFNAEKPVTIGQMGSFFNRLPDQDDDHTDDRPDSTGNRPGNDRPGGSDPEEEMCTTGLDLSNRERSLFASELRWVTLVGIEAQGAPGRPWPPHPDVPGGAEYLVVSQSPVWPVVDPGASWYVASDDGCLWEAASVQTRLTQLLPWRTGHRSMIEDAGKTRPGAGFDTFLRRWDSLTALQQARAQQHHQDRDVSSSCDLTAAMVASDSYGRCRWELPTPGVWSWQARACFEGIGLDATFHECATLARGVEWFLEIIDYTSGITLQNEAPGPGRDDAAGLGHHRQPRQPVRAG